MSSLNKIKKTNAYAVVRKLYKETIQNPYMKPLSKPLYAERLDIEAIYIDIQEKLTLYIDKMSNDGMLGRFCGSSSKKNIYSFVYIVMIYGLLGIEMDINMTKTIKEYILNCQSSDGMFYDSSIINYTFINGDGWGARHLMPHVIIAMQNLGITPKYNFSFLNIYHNYNLVKELMDSLDWTQVWTTSNYVMNIGVCLQYERDFLHCPEAGEGIKAIQDWLIKNIRSDSGMWYKGHPRSKNIKYDMLRGAYHLYPIIFYDNIDIPYAEKAIDTILLLQNNYGGFDYRSNSSACEDIDAIEPLVRISLMSDNYRKEEVDYCLKKALFWIRQNQMSDGGFVFRKGEFFDYGHKNVTSNINESNLFASWFRYLSVCYIYDYFTNFSHFKSSIPGYQYPLVK